MSDDRSVEAFDFLCTVVTVTTCSIELFGEIVEQKFSTTEFQIAVRRHRVKFLQHDRGLVGVPFYFDKSLQFGDICVAIKEQRLAFQSVAAGSTGFLIVAFDVLRQIHVHDKSNVRFVDAHSERDRCDDDLCFVVEERGLMPIARLFVEAGMIRKCAESFLAKVSRKRVDGVSAKAINYAALIFSVIEKFKKLSVRFLLWPNGVVNILSIETRYKNLGIFDLETLDNIFADQFVCGCSERDQRNIRKLSLQCSES